MRNSNITPVNFNKSVKTIIPQWDYFPENYKLEKIKMQLELKEEKEKEEKKMQAINFGELNN